mmetsp:Transcript_136471/g.236789  ORF Transcript_136471/g.236789 Transcript_136471/m.236789 type:complete len:1665 (-) Transcript_136471:70-5064(-)
MLPSWRVIRAFLWICVCLWDSCWTHGLNCSGVGDVSHVCSVIGNPQESVAVLISSSTDPSQVQSQQTLSLFNQYCNTFLDQTATLGVSINVTIYWACSLQIVDLILATTDTRWIITPMLQDYSSAAILWATLNQATNKLLFLLPSYPFHVTSSLAQVGNVNSQQEFISAIFSLTRHLGWYAVTMLVDNLVDVHIPVCHELDQQVINHTVLPCVRKLVPILGVSPESVDREINTAKATNSSVYVILATDGQVPSAMVSGLSRANMLLPSYTYIIAFINQGGSTGNHTSLATYTFGRSILPFASANTLILSTYVQASQTVAPAWEDTVGACFAVDAFGLIARTVQQLQPQGIPDDLSFVWAAVETQHFDGCTGRVAMKDRMRYGLKFSIHQLSLDAAPSLVKDIGTLETSSGGHSKDSRWSLTWRTDPVWHGNRKPLGVPFVVPVLDLFLEPKRRKELAQAVDGANQVLREGGKPMELVLTGPSSSTTSQDIAPVLEGSWFTCFYKASSIVAVIGGAARNNLRNLVPRLRSVLGVPFLALSPWDMLSDTNPDLYPFVLAQMPDDLEMATFVAKVLEQRRWHPFCILHTNEQHAYILSNHIKAAYMLGDPVLSIAWDWSIDTPEDDSRRHDEGPKKKLDEAMSDLASRECRVVVSIVTPEDDSRRNAQYPYAQHGLSHEQSHVKKILDTAMDMEILRGYNWIFTHTRDAFFNHPSDTGLGMFRSVPYVEKSRSPTAYIYDAVSLLRRALEKLIDDRLSIYDSESLFRTLAGLKFKGHSGIVSFEHAPNRRPNRRGQYVLENWVHPGHWKRVLVQNTETVRQHSSRYESNATASALRPVKAGWHVAADFVYAGNRTQFDNRPHIEVTWLQWPRDRVSRDMPTIYPCLHIQVTQNKDVPIDYLLEINITFVPCQDQNPLINPITGVLEGMPRGNGTYQWCNVQFVGVLDTCYTMDFGFDKKVHVIHHEPPKIFSEPCPNDSYVDPRTQGTTCSPCLTGSTCNGTAVSVALPNYWRTGRFKPQEPSARATAPGSVSDYVPDPNGTYIFCNNSACPGGLGPEGGSVCQPGSVGPFCGDCLRNYVYSLDTQQCLHCHGDRLPSLFMMLGITLMFLVVGYFQLTLLRKSDTESESGRLPNQLLMVAVNHLQIVSSVQRIIVEPTWRPASQNAIGIVSGLVTLSGDMLSYSYVCLFGKFPWRVMTMSLQPLSMSLLLFILAQVPLCIQRCRSPPTESATQQQSEKVSEAQRLHQRLRQRLLARKQARNCEGPDGPSDPARPNSTASSSSRQTAEGPGLDLLEGHTDTYHRVNDSKLCDHCHGTWVRATCADCATQLVDLCDDCNTALHPMGNPKLRRHRRVLVDVTTTEKSDRHGHRNLFWMSFWTMYNLLLVPVLREMVHHLMCSTPICVDGECTEYMEIMSLLACDSYEYMITTIISVIAILVWAVGVPLTAFLVIFVRRHHLSDKAVQSKYGFMYRDYHYYAYFWMPVVIMRKCAIVCCANLSGLASTTQQTLVLCIMVFSMLLNNQFKPYNPNTINHVETEGFWVNAVGILIYQVTKSRTIWTLLNVFGILFLIGWAFYRHPDLLWSSIKFWKRAWAQVRKKLHPHRRQLERTEVEWFPSAQWQQHIGSRVFGPGLTPNSTPRPPLSPSPDLDPCLTLNSTPRPSPLPQP